MTPRERASLLLLGPGAAALTTAAGATGGWRAALATAGALAVGAGVLLGLSTDDTEDADPVS